MGGYGLFVLAKAAWVALSGQSPEPFTMHAAKSSPNQRLVRAVISRHSYFGYLILRLHPFSPCSSTATRTVV